MKILPVSYANIIAPYCLGFSKDFLHLRAIHVILNTTKSDHINIRNKAAKKLPALFGAYRIIIVFTDCHFLGPVESIPQVHTLLKTRCNINLLSVLLSWTTRTPSTVACLHCFALCRQRPCDETSKVFCQTSQMLVVSELIQNSNSPEFLIRETKERKKKKPRMTDIQTERKNRLTNI